jgi:hypothetical protein
VQRDFEDEDIVLNGCFHGSVVWGWWYWFICRSI